MGMYVTADEVRNYTNISSGEYSDAQVNFFISSSVAEIDARTGRTWQGIATSSDEYYDGNGTSRLQLKRNDIQDVTSLAIDDDNDDIFTTLSGSNPAWYDWYDYGLIKLITASSSISVFPENQKNVKVTYTYGNSTVPDDVKMLTVQLVAERINPDQSRRDFIERKIKELKHIGASLL